MSSTIEELNFETKAVKVEQTVKRVNGQLGGLTKVVKSLGTAIAKAFDFSAAVDYIGEALTASGNLDKQLLVLRLSLGKLKSAIGEATAPIISAFLPMVQQAVYASTRWVKSVGKVVAALFGGTVQTEDMAAAQKNLAVSSGKAARSLASFDEIERLDKGSGSSGGSTGEVTLPKMQDPLTPQLQTVVDRIQAVMTKIRSLLQPLKEIDFTPAAQAFSGLGQSIAAFGGSVVKGLEWAWHNLLVPLAQWTIEAAVPAAVQLLTQGFSALSAVLTPLGAGFRELLTALSPVAAFLGQTVVRILDGLTAQLGSLGEAFIREGGRIQSIFSGLSTAINQLWALASPVLTRLGVLWDQVMGSLARATDNGISTVVGVLEGLAQFVAGVFAADWQRAWQGLTGVVSSVWTGLQRGLKDSVNGIIGVLNWLLSGVTSGINALIRGLNALSFTVPDWVPILGGESFGFNLSTVKAPQIPYLAQGAVLPANQPFLAVVGDQRSGTNVEAPLSVIQEAVAAVMGDQLDAMMAGFTALLQENRQLRSVVEGIELGDTTIGQAARRYNARLAIMRGV